MVGPDSILLHNYNWELKVINKKTIGVIS